MRIGEIYDLLNEISPFELQEGWDNGGLLLGERSQEVSRVVLSVDIDEAMIDEAEGDTLFVLHHPLIFSGLKRLVWSEYPAVLLKKLIRKNQALIAMHTNFDVTHLNRYVFTEVLGFEGAECEGFVCYAEGDWEAEALLAQVKERLGLPTMRVVGEKARIERVAMTTGSGASLMDGVRADLFLTGDIKFHDAMKAQATGPMLADIGHFESEKFFPQALSPHLKNLPIPVIIAQSKNPFRYI
ncbi:Nif3-like dinuclear metal center hexameric protein [Hydrogenimonas sp.]